MSEYCNIKAVVIPPAMAGTVLLTGAAELVADTILDLDVEMDYFQREVALDGAGVTCIKVELENELPEQIAHRIQAALANLIEETQELTGWTSSVNLVQATDDDQEEPGSGDLDAEGEKLLPSGEELAASLLQDIQHEEAVYAAANLFQALPLEDLCTEDLDGLGSAELAAAMRRASALAGCLIYCGIYAADIVIDELIDDIVNLRDEESDTSTSAIEDTWVFCQLPARFAVDYTPLFAQKLLVAVVDVTGRPLISAV